MCKGISKNDLFCDTHLCKDCADLNGKDAGSVFCDGKKKYN